MSTNITINGPCSLYFNPDGSYIIAGGAGSANSVPYNAAEHPVRFTINHEDWQRRFSPVGAAAFFAFSVDPAAPGAAIPEQTVITFDGGTKTVTLEQGNTATITRVNTVGVMADITVEATTVILLNVILQPTACTRPPCPPTIVSHSLGLPPL